MRGYLLALSLLVILAIGCDQPPGQTTLAQQPASEAPGSSASSDRMPGVPQTLRTVEEREVMPSLTLVGAVRAARRSTVGSAVDGRVMSVPIEEGDRVTVMEEGGRRVGQPIAQLLTETISIEILIAEAELALRKQELRELETGTRPEEVAQAEARLESAKADKEYADARFRRVEALMISRTASDDLVDESRSAALAAQQALLVAQAAYELAVAGPREEKIDQARARVAAQQATVRRLEDQRKKYTVRAPFDGFVVAKHAEVGAWLSRGDPVAEIAELDPVDIEVEVPESFIAQIRDGSETEVPVTIEGLPSTHGQLIGTVHRIIPSADLRARTFPVKIRLSNLFVEGRPLLKAGMLARAKLSGAKYKALMVPKDALVLEEDMLGQPMQFVMVAGSNGDGQPAPRKVRVETGVSDEGLIEVRGELEAGQQVYVLGNESMRPG